jgi:hypothetical protein
VDNISRYLELAQERMGHALMVVSTITFSNRPAYREGCIERDIKIIKTNKKIRVIGMVVGQPGADDPVICSAGSATEGTGHAASVCFSVARRKEVLSA